MLILDEGPRRNGILIISIISGISKSVFSVFSLAVFSFLASDLG